MDWIIMCVYASFIMYLVYNVYALKLFKVPKSLSMTYYLFQDKNKQLRILFPIMMIFVAFLLMPAWLEISNGSDFQFFAFLAAAGIIFTGTAPAFKSSSLEKKVHTGSATFAAIFALLWVAVVANMWYLIIFWMILIVCVAIITKTIKNSYIYWLETVAFLSTFTSIIYFMS